jgi:hypothetical protein
LIIKSKSNSELFSFTVKKESRTEIVLEKLMASGSLFLGINSSGGMIPP